MTMMPNELADKIISESHLPTDGRQILPVNVNTVRALLARAITEDRKTVEPDFDAIANKVLLNYSHGETIHMLHTRNAIMAALRHAQAGGARFTVGGPSEADYAEAVGAAVESFCTALKNKGFGN